MRLERLRASCFRAAAAAAVLVTAIATVVLAPPAADAVVRTASGVRCTIVGTPGRDLLIGTPHRDVICGRGGNDAIRGRGGNDLIYGGPGKDSLSGNEGNDVLYGGAGPDFLYGGIGSDRLSGGRDNDRITGSSGDDVVRGGAGDEQINGGPGNDRISGGDGADLEAGDDGDDVVVGDIGDDELSGGVGGDLVDGGAGFNICDVPSSVTDRQFRCVVDTSKPVVGDVTVSPPVVDVTSGSQVIQIRAHVTDDTGVKIVQLGSTMASRISGTARDGIWLTATTVPRYAAPGPRDLDVHARDRVGRDTWQIRKSAYTVLDSVYDKAMPVLQSLSLSTSSVDVRSSAQTITTTVRVTDDLAGPANLYVCPAHAMPTGTPSFRQSGGCEPMKKVSGIATDSTWKGTLTIPQGAPSGTWNVEVWISDAAGNLGVDFWLGPDAFAALGTTTTDPRYKPIPNGAGAFTVIGSAPDTNAPVLTSLTLTPSTVDTSWGAVLVTADIAGTDVEGITDAHLFISGYPGYPDNPSWADYLQIAWVSDFQLISGTATNGVWRATFVVPGGTPDGTYFIQATVQDSAHFESWVSSDSGWTTDSHVLTDALAPSGTHFVVANSP